MALDRANVVDAVGTDKATGEVVLTVIDALPWDDPKHLELLQDKLNAYFAFIESKELLAEYPGAVGRSIRIDVICRYDIPANASKFLNQARAVALKLDAALSWRTYRGKAA